VCPSGSTGKPCGRGIERLSGGEDGPAVAAAVFDVPKERVGRKDEHGLTLIEVVISAAVLTIAVVSVLTSVTAGYTGVDFGRQQSTAVFLAEQKLEEIRGYSLSTATGQGYTNVNTASFPAEAYGSIASHPLFRRTVAVTDSPGGTANTKLVTVTVFFRPQNTIGSASETSVILNTLVTAR
jgi:Tfp pilus assembly protein PilV